jgi:hypothetical protein
MYRYVCTNPKKACCFIELGGVPAAHVQEEFFPQPLKPVWSKNSCQLSVPSSQLPLRRLRPLKGSNNREFFGSVLVVSGSKRHIEDRSIYSWLRLTSGAADQDTGGEDQRSA